MKPLLELENVTVEKDGKVLLEAVSLEVEPGTIHVLAGPNGAGKSTLFSALLGRTDFSGSIRFHWRGSGRIGYVPQRFVVDRTLPLTVAEFLALPRRRRLVCLGIGKGARQEAEALLVRVALPGFGPRWLNALSGGELQRVLLANALDPLPELLLLDEPASGLDEIAARSFEQILVELRRSTTVLMVSHDLTQARRIADRITVIDRTVRSSAAPESRPLP